jgi:N-acetylglucosamine kinase-like BadF-type ATPase
MDRATGWTVIDAGGSGSVLAGRHGRSRYPSVNPASVGTVTAGNTLTALFAEVAASTPPGCGVWFASAGLDPAAPQEELGRVQAAAAAARLEGPVVVSSDIVALLLIGLHAGAGRTSGAVAVVSGTGSGVRAGRLDAAPVSVGSQEYLASDEGSAFAIAQDGLRAAVRAGDGRGPASILGQRFAARAGMPLHRLARDLAGIPFPKTAVAALADVVTQAWQDGDPVAAGVIEQALHDLQVAVLAGVRRAALRPGWRAVLAGGVLAGSPSLRTTLADRLAAVGAADSIAVSDPATSMVEALAGLAGPVPDSWLGSVAWTLDPADRRMAGRSR